MERICVKCLKSKDLEQFKKLHGSGYSGYCESCRCSARLSMRRIKTKEERTRAHKEWRKDNPKVVAYRKRRNLMLYHGLTLEEFNVLSAKQNHLCAICNTKHADNSFFDRLVVDHNHRDNTIRGLLCSNCNTAIGLMKENITNMQNMIQYLLDSNYKVIK